MKTAIITFFDTYPAKTGSGTVCTDFFNSWPLPNKKLFQFSKSDISKKYRKYFDLYKSSLL